MNRLDNIMIRLSEIPAKILHLQPKTTRRGVTRYYHYKQHLHLHLRCTLQLAFWRVGDISGTTRRWHGRPAIQCSGWTCTGLCRGWRWQRCSCTVSRWSLSRSEGSEGELAKTTHSTFNPSNRTLSYLIFSTYQQHQQVLYAGFLCMYYCGTILRWWTSKQFFNI